jgi:hypothetical protein
MEEPNSTSLSASQKSLEESLVVINNNLQAIEQEMRNATESAEEFKNCLTEKLKMEKDHRDKQEKLQRQLDLILAEKKLEETQFTERRAALMKQISTLKPLAVQKEEARKKIDLLQENKIFVENFIFSCKALSGLEKDPDPEVNKLMNVTAEKFITALEKEDPTKMINSLVTPPSTVPTAATNHLSPSSNALKRHQQPPIPPPPPPKRTTIVSDEEEDGDEEEEEEEDEEDELGHEDEDAKKETAKALISIGSNPGANTYDGDEYDVPGFTLVGKTEPPSLPIPATKSYVGSPKKQNKTYKLVLRAHGGDVLEILKRTNNEENRVFREIAREKFNLVFGVGLDPRDYYVWIFVYLEGTKNTVRLISYHYAAKRYEHGKNKTTPMYKRIKRT